MAERSDKRLPRIVKRISRISADLIPVHMHALEQLSFVLSQEKGLEEKIVLGVVGQKKVDQRDVDVSWRDRMKDSRFKPPKLHYYPKEGVAVAVLRDEYVGAYGIESIFYIPQEDRFLSVRTEKIHYSHRGFLSPAHTTVEFKGHKRLKPQEVLQKINVAEQLARIAKYASLPKKDRTRPLSYHLD